MPVTAPPGRVYSFPSFTTKAGPQLVLGSARFAYAEREGKDAQWCRCHPSQFDAFAPLWPGAVFAEDAQLKGTIRLGRGEMDLIEQALKHGLNEDGRCDTCMEWWTEFDSNGKASRGSAIASFYPCLSRRLAEALAASQARVARLEQALALYADRDTYWVWFETPASGGVYVKSRALTDRGAAAREALAEGKE